MRLNHTQDTLTSSLPNHYSTMNSVPAQDGNLESIVPTLRMLNRFIASGGRDRKTWENLSTAPIVGNQ
jgi:hypothetical protein